MLQGKHKEIRAKARRKTVLNRMVMVYVGCSIDEEHEVWCLKDVGIEECTRYRGTGTYC